FFLVPETNSEQSAHTPVITFPNALTLGDCIVGLWVTSQAVRPLSSCLRYFWMPAPSYDPDMYIGPLIMGILFLGSGMTLVMQAHKISGKLISRYRLASNEETPL